jgi:hypothetical protein
MFSHNLYQALCQNSASDAHAHPRLEDDGAMVDAIQRALETYQRLFSQSPNSAD